MKNFVLFTSFLICSFANADDDSIMNDSTENFTRLSMVGPPPENEAIKDLLGRVSESCSSKNFVGFMNCFTERKASSIRKQAENLFICGSVEMDVLDFFVISSEEDSISFGIRYLWIDGRGKITYCSKVNAKKQDGDWKIDSEEIRSFQASSAPKDPALPVLNCANGMCNIRPVARQNQQQPVWRAPNPANGGEEAFLPRDILYMPGPSCANGNCKIR